MIAATIAARIVVPRTAMAAPAAMQRETIALAVVAVRSVALLRLTLLSAGDEGGKAVDIAALGRSATLMRPRLRLRLIALREGLCVARNVGLLAGPIRLFAHADDRLLILAFAFAVFERFVARAGDFGLLTGKVRIVLPELLLGGGDQAEIMFGVLEIVFGGNRIPGCLRIAGELHVLFGDVRGVTANFYFRTIRLINAGH